MAPGPLPGLRPANSPRHGAQLDPHAPYGRKLRAEGPEPAPGRHADVQNKRSRANRTSLQEICKGPPVSPFSWTHNPRRNSENLSAFDFRHKRLPCTLLGGRGESCRDDGGQAPTRWISGSFVGLNLGHEAILQVIIGQLRRSLLAAVANRPLAATASFCAAEMVSTLEDPRTRPSRKSIRRSANSARAPTQLTRQRKARPTSPRSRHE